MRRVPIVFLALLVGCVTIPPPVQIARTPIGPLAPAMARVVFFVPPGERTPGTFDDDPPPRCEHNPEPLECNTFYYGTLLADERGDVLGTVWPGAYLVVDLPPGDHELFAHDNAQLAWDCRPCAGVMTAHLTPGAVYAVAIRHLARYRADVASVLRREQVDLERAHAAPVGEPGWTRIVPGGHETAWAARHASEIEALIASGRARMAQPAEWNARAATLE